MKSGYNCNRFVQNVLHWYFNVVYFEDYRNVSAASNLLTGELSRLQIKYGEVGDKIDVFGDSQEMHHFRQVHVSGA